MKFQISFDFTDLEKALEVAQKVAPFVDILEVGTILIYKSGVTAVERFKDKFPDKIIFADAKIVDRPREAVEIFSQAGADYISVLAGTNNDIIRTAAQTAHSNKSKVALNLVDAYSPGQSVMDAKTLGVDLILCHKPIAPNRLNDSLADWQYVRGNTSLPLFIAGGINKTNISKVLELKPQGIALGSVITDADDPAKEAEYFRALIK